MIDYKTVQEMVELVKTSDAAAALLGLQLKFFQAMRVEIMVLLPQQREAILRDQLIGNGELLNEMIGHWEDVQRQAKLNQG